MKLKYLKNIKNWLKLKLIEEIQVLISFAKFNK